MLEKSPPVFLAGFVASYPASQLESNEEMTSSPVTSGATSERGTASAGWHCPNPIAGFHTRGQSLLPYFQQIRSEDDQPLAGVLLSLSGGVFRSNLLTQDNGMLTFSNLVRPSPAFLPADIGIRGVVREQTYCGCQGPVVF